MNGLQQIWVLTQGIPWESLNNPACCQSYTSCSPKTDDGKTLFAAETYPGHWAHNSWTGAYLVFLAMKGAPYTFKGETITNPATNPLIFNNVLPARYTIVRVAQILWE